MDGLLKNSFSELPLALARPATNCKRGTVFHGSARERGAVALFRQPAQPPA
jgi:hypothetical protein